MSIDSTRRMDSASSTAAAGHSGSAPTLALVSAVTRDQTPAQAQR
jgi:hypothetical protein